MYDHDTQRCESSASDTGSTTSGSQNLVGHFVECSLPLAADYPQQQSDSYLPLLMALSRTMKALPLPSGSCLSTILKFLVTVHLFSTMPLRTTAFCLIIHPGETALLPVPTLAMPLLRMVRKVPTNSSTRIRDRREMFQLGRPQALRN